MGGSTEVFTSQDEYEQFNYANVRKATYRGIKNYLKINYYFNYSFNQHYISVFKFCVIWGIFLTWFAEALLFDMMVSTDFEEPIDSIDDLIERDMTLSKYSVEIFKIYDE